MMTIVKEHRGSARNKSGTEEKRERVLWLEARLTFQRCEGEGDRRAGKALCLLTAALPCARSAAICGASAHLSALTVDQY